MLFTDKELIRAYRRMKTIREFEERLHLEIATGEIAGSHICTASGSGRRRHLRTPGNDDFIVSTHRGHGHCIAKGATSRDDERDLRRRDGLCHGKGGSMHIADVEVGMLGANGIVAPVLRWHWEPAGGESQWQGQVAIAFSGDAPAIRAPRSKR